MAHSISLYEIFSRNLKGEGDAKAAVQEIENMVAEAIEVKSKEFSNKSDIETIKGEIEIIKLTIEELKQQIIKFQLELEKRISSLIIWLIGVVFAAGVFFITVAKLLF